MVSPVSWSLAKEMLMLFPWMIVLYMVHLPGIAPDLLP
jgi:hypothetical protein